MLNYVKKNIYTKWRKWKKHISIKRKYWKTELFEYFILFSVNTNSPGKLTSTTEVESMRIARKSKENITFQMWFKCIDLERWRTNIQRNIIISSLIVGIIFHWFYFIGNHLLFAIANNVLCVSLEAFASSSFQRARKNHSIETDNCMITTFCFYLFYVFRSFSSMRKREEILWCLKEILCVHNIQRVIVAFHSRQRSP